MSFLISFCRWHSFPYSQCRAVACGMPL